MNKFAVLGLGKFGTTVATSLYEQGAEVIAIDKNEKIVDEVQGKVTTALVLDITDEKGLKQIGIQEMTAVILAVADSLETSILASVILKKMKVQTIYAKVESKIHKKILETLGIKNVVFPEELIGLQLSKSLLFKNVTDYMDLSTGHSMVELKVPLQYAGKSLQELSFPSKKGVNIIAIKYLKRYVSEEGENFSEYRVNDRPKANDIVNKDDILILLGSKSRINSIIEEFSKG